METIKKSAKEWCAKHSNKGCEMSCDGCWQRATVFGCEQCNMEFAYIQGAKFVLDQIQPFLKVGVNSIEASQLYGSLRDKVDFLNSEFL